jgi:hypothetical protein
MNVVNCVCIDKEVQLKSNPQHNEPDQLHHNCPVACVIAQQYSSTTSGSLHFHSHKEKFGMNFKKVTSFF